MKRTTVLKINEIMLLSIKQTESMIRDWEMRLEKTEGLAEVDPGKGREKAIDNCKKIIEGLKSKENELISAYSDFLKDHWEVI